MKTEDEINQAYVQICVAIGDLTQKIRVATNTHDAHIALLKTQIETQHAAVDALNTENQARLSAEAEASKAKIAAAEAKRERKGLKAVPDTSEGEIVESAPPEATPAAEPVKS
jgi:hypothetical protein